MKQVEACKLIYGHDRAIANWVSDKLKMSGEWMGDHVAIGVIKNNQLIAGVVYYAYRWPNIEMACASESPRWLNKKNLFAFFKYPFYQLGCKRVTSIVDVDNERAIKFNEKLGFIRECTLKDANPSGDAHLYRMLIDECKWLKYGLKIKQNENCCTRS